MSEHRGNSTTSSQDSGFKPSIMAELLDNLVSFLPIGSLWLTGWDSDENAPPRYSTMTLVMPSQVDSKQAGEVWRAEYIAKTFLPLSLKLVIITWLFKGEVSVSICTWCQQHLLNQGWWVIELSQRWWWYNELYDYRSSSVYLCNLKTHPSMIPKHK